MSLLDEFKEKGDTGGDYPSHGDIAYDLGARKVHDEITGETRWGTLQEVVYQRDDEFVRITYEVGGGESNVPYEPEFSEVRPVDVMITQYLPV